MEIKKNVEEVISFESTSHDAWDMEGHQVAKEKERHLTDGDYGGHYLV